MQKTKILLIHLIANGDCLMATTIARQIKQDYPDCHLTWAISYKCRQVLENNPFVDDIWEIHYGKEDSPVGNIWHKVKKEAYEKKLAGIFDLIFETQVYPDNIHNFDGTTRSSTFRNYPNPITVPVQPILNPTIEEEKRVACFVEKHELQKWKFKILLECAPNSGQSKLSLEKGIQLANKIVTMREDTIVIISSHLKFDPPHERILDGSILSFRENVPLSHYCNFFVGASSGINWLLTSNNAKLLPMVIFLNRHAFASSFASVEYDFEYFKLPRHDIIESCLENNDDMAQVVLAALENFAAARAEYHQKLKPNFWDFLCFVDYHSIKGPLKIGHTFRCFKSRNNFTWRDALHISPIFRIIFITLKMIFSFVGRKIGNRVKD